MASEQVRQSHRAEPRFFYGYVVVVVASFIMLMMWGTFTTFGVFFKSMLSQFGWTRAVISGAFSLATIAQGLLNVGAGRLTDKFGPRRVLSVCGFFLGLGFILMSQISAIWQLYLFYGVILGIGMGGSIVPLSSTVARWFIKRRAMMTGITFAGMGLGTMIMPLIANQLISAYGWRASYIIAGIAALVLVVLAAQFLRRNPKQIGQLPYGASEVNRESLDSEVSGVSLREAIHTKQFWLLSAMYFCFLFSSVTILVHIVLHTIGQGLSANVGANILAVIGGASIGGMLAIGSAADRIGNKAGLTISFVVMSIALFWLLASRDIWMLFLFAAIFGFAYGGLQAVLSPMVAQLFGLSSHGVILGAANLAGSIGAASGPFIAGFIFDVTGSYQFAFLILAALGVTGVILSARLTPLVKS